MKKLVEFFKHPTSIDVIINTIGNYLNIIFTFFFALLLVRILDLKEYGVMSVLLGIAYVLANILDFGTTATIYSYLPTLYQNKSFGLYKFIKSTFFFQSLFSMIVISILIITFPILDKYFFHTKAPVWELNMTAISVMLFIWQNFIQNILFAAKKFVRANIYLNLSNLLKTLVILYLAWMHMVTVGSIIFVFGILGPVIFFTLVFIEKRGMLFILAKAPVHKEELRFGYTMTYFIGSQFFNLGSRMDLFLLSYFGLREQVGYYGLSQKIILAVISTVVSVTQVLSSGFSEIKYKKDVPGHLKTAFYYLLFPSALFGIIFLLPNFIYSFAFTQRFAEAAPVSKALALPFIVYTLGSIPMLFILYTVKKPVYLLYSNIIFFVIISVGCLYLIPLKGAYGPPIALAIAFVVSTLFLSVISLWEYRKLEKNLE